YMDNPIEVCWEGKHVKVGRGLRQGCPLSPILFMIYLSGIERELEESGLGFDLSCRVDGHRRMQKIPALIYADDIVIMVDTREELRDMMEICGKGGEASGLKFSREKSGVMTYNARLEMPLYIQGADIGGVEKYK
ncbi:reverse transcriptase domain-containing protein, partial [Bradyrhizobium sp. 33ap4]|uniref:reverse transcriptase domain-containing protein n=1 Tax=Bradyrhizobium sp. 33ap4 TaxID=3061630 RepID=UPI00292D1FDF